MPPIASVPPTFTISSAGGYTVTFPIPSGVYSSGTWDIDAEPSHSATDSITTQTSGDKVDFDAHTTSPYTDTKPLSVDQIADVNAHAGGNLTAELGATDGMTDVNSLTLTLVGTSGTVVVNVQVQDLHTFLDPIGEWVQAMWPVLGLGNGETNTHASFAARFRDNVQELNNSDLKASITRLSKDLAYKCRADTEFYRLRDILAAFNNDLTSKLKPIGWQFVTGIGGLLALDAFLTYVNGMQGGAQPEDAGVVTAGFNAAGRLSPFVSGDAPYIVHVHKKGKDYLASPPSPVSNQVALTAPNNRLIYTIPGTVPTGVTDISIFRTPVGTPDTGPFYWEQDVQVTAGEAYPVINLDKPDIKLLSFWQPPQWASCLIHPGAAIAIALATSFSTPSDIESPLQFQSWGMISPENITLIPANIELGFNPSFSMAFGSLIIGTGYTENAYSRANLANYNLIGFLGSIKVRGRVSVAADDAFDLAIDYDYLDASSPDLPLSDTSSVISFSTGDAGEIAYFDIPEGRVVIAVTDVVVTGAATSGAVVIEAGQ